ncbi:MAG: hypothetical protein MO852_13375, partial [Candidatus Devosia euplotis]|nr:hypothetical protein [Candidatus Devosia euplotis]
TSPSAWFAPPQVDAGGHIDVQLLRTKDPAVFRYLEGNSEPTKQADRLSEWLKSLANNHAPTARWLHHAPWDMSR